MATTTSSATGRGAVSRRSRSFDPAVELSAGWVTRLVRYWPLTIAFVVLGVLGGYGTGNGKPAVYTSEEQIAVGYAQNNLSSGATAGYATAAAQLASNYARYVNDASLGGTSAAGDVHVEGTAIDESNVIRVIATSGDSRGAITAASAAGDQLVKKINDGSSDASPDAIKANYDTAVDKWSAYNAAQVSAQSQLSSAIGQGAGAATIDSLRDALASAQADYAKQDLIKNGLAAQYQNASVSGGAAKLTVINPAATVTSDHHATVLRYTLVGLGVGLVLALIAASIVDVVRRRTGRSRRRSGSSSSATWSTNN